MELWVSPSGKKIDAPKGHVDAFLHNPKLFGSKVEFEIEMLKQKFGGIPEDDVNFDIALEDINVKLLRTGWFTISDKWDSGITIFTFKFDDKVKREILSALVDLGFDHGTKLSIIYGAHGKYVGTIESALASSLQEKRFRRLMKRSFLEWKPKSERIDFEGETGSWVGWGNDVIYGDFNTFKLPKGGTVRIYCQDQGYECLNSSGQFHRISGPARHIRSTFYGRTDIEYWVNGRKFTEEEFDKHFGDE